MEEAAVAAVVEQLEGLDWFFFSGFAVSLYGRGQREIGDLDIAVASEDLSQFADRVDADVRHRRFEKDGTTVDDYGFETVFNGVDIEVTSGFPPHRRESGAFDKLFDHAVEETYQQVSVSLVPFEELIIHKAFMFREKDQRDLRSLSHRPADTDFLNELIMDWQVSRRKIRKRLDQSGFEL